MHQSDQINAHLKIPFDNLKGFYKKLCTDQVFFPVLACYKFLITQVVK